MTDARWRDWLPIAVRGSAAEPVIDWGNFHGLRFTEPFFQQTVSRALRHPARLLFRRESPIGFLETLARDCPGLPPTGFIFHLSRCGSTLVSRMLAACPANLVLSEPGPVDRVLGLLPDDAAPGPDPRIGWLRGLLSAWAQPRAGETRLFVKFDCWHIRDLPLIRQAFPAVPWIFLYRDPVEVLVSHCRMPGMQTVPGLLDPRRLGLDPATVDPAALGEYTARVLAQLCQAALTHLGDGRGRLISYPELPAAVPGVIARHFGLTLSPQEEAQMTAAAQFDAKNPTSTYRPDSASKQAEATAELRQRARVWLGDLYDRLESARRD